MTHQRRTGGKIGVEERFTEDMKLTTTEDIFLANVTNKQDFIDMLNRYLQREGCVKHHAQGDADLMIAHTAVQSAASKNTAVIADDTDLVIILCYYAESVGFDLFMQCSAKSSTKKDHIWNIKTTRNELGANIYDSIPFVHAILGCDTTSRLYGHGKALSLKIITLSSFIRDTARQFSKQDAMIDEVVDA